jgi:hypothetical protein
MIMRGRTSHKVCRLSLSVLLVSATAAGLAGASTAHATTQASVTFQPIATAFSSMIGLGYSEPTNSLLVSDNYPSGQPHNFDLIGASGTQTQFSAAHGLGDEVYPAAIRTTSCLQTFNVGDVYVGTGAPGVIGKISADGTHVTPAWVTLPNEQGLLRGGITQDVACSWNGDLIATTTAGDVWRIKSNGVATLVANLGIAGNVLEGPTTIPNDSSKYGPLAGLLMAADETSGSVWVVAPNGVFKQVVIGHQPEDVRVVPANESYYAVNYAGNAIMEVDAGELTHYVGDIFVQSEIDGALLDLHWNSSTHKFALNQLGAIPGGVVEGATFAPIGVATQQVAHLVWSQLPIAATKSLPPCTPVAVSVQAQDANNNPIPSARVYLGFAPTTHGGTAADSQGAALTPTVRAYNTDAGGNLSVVYTNSCDTTNPPTGGQDVLIAQSAASGDAVTSYDVYRYSTVSKYAMTPSPMAPDGSLGQSQTVNVTVTAEKANGVAVPNAVAYLSLTPNPIDDSGTASVGATPLTTTPQPFATNSQGQVVVTYAAADIIVPGAVGADTVSVTDAPHLPVTTQHDGYNYHS